MNTPMPEVPSERVIELLTEDPLGRALLEAAKYRALSEALMGRIKHLEEQQDIVRSVADDA